MENGGEYQQPKKESKYKMLHDRGVLLDDEAIDYIVDQLVGGIQDTYDYLKIEDKDRTLGFMSSDNLDRIGYAEEQQALNIPVEFMNKIAAAGKKPSELLIPLGTLVQRNVDFTRYLLNVGREEAIHHFQKKGNPMLRASIPDRDRYMKGTEVDRLTCDYEVEARKITDQIAETKHEEPLWKPLDDFLQKEYPNQYNKPLLSSDK